MKLNHNKISCIKLVHLLYLYIYDARSHLYQILVVLDLFIYYYLNPLYDLLNSSCDWSCVSQRSETDRGP